MTNAELDVLLDDAKKLLEHALTAASTAKTSLELRAAMDLAKLAGMRVDASMKKIRNEILGQMT